VPFASIDWAIILGYLLFALIIGILVSRSASKSLTAYFAADRSLPWWLLGTSMVATTFAADTPLVITGMVAKYGIAGNWLWWCWGLGFVAMTVFFAGHWRKSEVLTDAEIIELRYRGKPAAWLRGFKACFMALVLNCIILGWVFRAMSKIADPFIRWDAILGEASFASLAAAWPSWMVFDNPNNTLTVLVIFALTVVYSSLGGIRSVILTDLLQFVMAMAGSILLAVYGVAYVGGTPGLLEKLHGLYPNADELLRFTPSLDAAWLPFQVFLIYIFVQWWAKQDSDGSGYLAQRLMTAKTPREATKGSLWFTVAFLAVRTWPWVMVGLVALVLFPKGAETSIFAAGAQVAGDREMAYPILMKLLLPPGALGLLFASLLAAFMSTVDTHLNWGTSYLVNDIYKRFLRPEAPGNELVLVSRIGMVGLALVALLVAGQIGSIEKAWKFFFALTAGMGLPSMLRWLWWRANAWTEIAGMGSAILTAILLYSMTTGLRDEYILLIVALVSTVFALTATFLTPPVDDETLKAFHDRVKPAGWWASAVPDAQGPKVFWRLAGAWCLGTAGVCAALFGVGHFLLTSKLLGLALLSASGGALHTAFRLIHPEPA